jgi:hypothetical protein
MVAFSVSQTTLSKTSITANQQRIKGASVLPFFCKTGQVKRLMILLPELSIPLMIPFEKGVATVSLPGTVKLCVDLSAWDTYSDFTPKHIEDLYHYDPNWLLSRERFSAYWAKTLIQQSNCAGFLNKKVREIRFARDLSLIERVVMRQWYLNTFRTPSTEALLSVMPPTKSEQSDLSIEGATRGWQLKPIWWGNGFH